MLRRASGSIRPGSVVLVVVCVAVAAVVGSTIAGGAPRQIKRVIVKNPPAKPVPVTSKPALLRSGRFDFSGPTSEPIPAGVVLTDLIVWGMNEQCEVALRLGDEGAVRLAPLPDAGDRLAAELHLETGLESTTERPLTLSQGGGPFCSTMSAFWSGFER